MKLDLIQYLENRISKLNKIIDHEYRQYDFQDVLMARHQKHQQWNLSNKARANQKTIGENIEILKKELSDVEKLIRYSKDLS